MDLIILITKKKKMITKTYINSDEKTFNKYKIIWINILIEIIELKVNFIKSDFEKINTKNNNHNIEYNLFFSINHPDKFKTVSTRQNGFLYLSLGKVKSIKFIWIIN